ncbi:S-adenosyl-L-methionine-dependent methyltransferase [Blastocladiella britannica]|nr:S-adenosyl-L-methionine-dependent methyltransferase [Blastocladiella britannica]
MGAIDLILKKQQIVTPWDKGEIAPALASLLAQSRIPNGRVLVPGCGRGCDVLALGTPDRKAYGIDISPTAHPNPQAKFVLADFFAFTNADLEPSTGSATSGVPQFDALYDYTFMCALPPSMRSDWAARVAALVRPGGTLVTLMYPIDASRPLDEGPPFPVNPDVYRGLLADKFEEVEVSKCESFAARKGLEMVGVWTRRS